MIANILTLVAFLVGVVGLAWLVWMARVDSQRITRELRDEMEGGEWFDR